MKGFGISIRKLELFRQ